jgi:acylphosphatase
LGLHGWVRNLPDGRVEIVAAGPPESITAIDAMVRSGPLMARVDYVESNEYPHEVDVPKTFEVR